MNVTLYGKETKDVLKLRILRWGGSPRLPGQAHVIARVLIRGRQQESEVAVTTKTGTETKRLEDATLLALQIEEMDRQRP